MFLTKLALLHNYGNLVGTQAYIATVVCVRVHLGAIIPFGVSQTSNAALP
jgi:hypothetical protein